MATEIQTWHISDGKLVALDQSLPDAGLKETAHLERWIESNPEILGEGIQIIGKQVSTKSGPLDLLGIDKTGGLVVIELKRNRIPRDALAQAIDYASDVAAWDKDKLSEVCAHYTQKSLEEFVAEKFDDINAEDWTVNSTQRILLVGFSIEEALVRMIEWLSDRFDVSINAVLLHFVQTKSGDQFISRTSIIPEEIETERRRKKQIKPLVWKTPGNYPDGVLREKLKKFLQKETRGAARIREVLFPMLLKSECVDREMLKRELVQRKEAADESRAGLLITSISNLLAYKNRDYLGQVVGFDHVDGRPWEKTNFRLLPQYKVLVNEILQELADES